MFPHVIKSHHHRPCPLREEKKGLGNVPMRVGREANEKGNGGKGGKGGEGGRTDEDCI